MREGGHRLHLGPLTPGFHFFPLHPDSVLKDTIPIRGILISPK